MDNDFPLLVDSAGESKHLNHKCFQGAPVVVLVGGTNAHYGTRMMTPCRLVADIDSPLRFSASGEVLPMANPKLAGGHIWLVLTIASGAGFDAVKALYGKHVRLEYEDSK